jgi:hypothetical protein
VGIFSGGGGGGRGNREASSGARAHFVSRLNGGGVKRRHLLKRKAKTAATVRPLQAPKRSPCSWPGPSRLRINSSPAPTSDALEDSRWGQHAAPLQGEAATPSWPRYWNYGSGNKLARAEKSTHVVVRICQRLDVHGRSIPLNFRHLLNRVQSWRESCLSNTGIKDPKGSARPKRKKSSSRCHRRSRRRCE